jgi:hypothetical protein
VIVGFAKKASSASGKKMDSTKFAGTGSATGRQEGQRHRKGPQHLNQLGQTRQRPGSSGHIESFKLFFKQGRWPNFRV